MVDIKSSYGLFINGEFVDGSGKAFKTISPSTEEVLAEVAEADDADVDQAVKAARRAYNRVWSKMSGAERGKYLFRIARIIQERAREIAVLESIDNGKPIKESRDVDIPTAAAHFFYYAGWADKLEYAGYGPDPQPLGVAGQVIPWNFPFLMLAWKIAPALACGNTVVLKPAETTPLTALLFAEICQQADLPPGVVNILTGAGATGQAIVSHDDVDKVAFTGSTDVGRAIAKAVAGSKKKVTLELGGKAANIVFDDAPVDQAVEGIVNGIFFNQGHVCCAGSRLLVQESVAEEVLEQAQAPDVDAARGRPARQEHRHRRDQLRRAARQDPRALRHRRGRGRRSLVAAVRPARPRLLVPADDLHRRHRGPPDRPRGDLRPGALGDHLPDAEGGGREGQQHAVRPLGGHLDRQGLAHAVDGRRSCAPASSGPTRSTASTRPARSAATRSRATAARAAATDWRGTCNELASTYARPTSSTSAGPSPARSRAAPTWSTTPRGSSGPTPRTPPARTPATP